MCISNSEYFLILWYIPTHCWKGLGFLLTFTSLLGLISPLVFGNSWCLLNHFQGLKTHKSAIAYVFFCSYTKYEVTKEQINYLWLILYSNKEWLNGGTYHFWMHCSLFFPELESLLTKFKMYTLLSPQKEITFLTQLSKLQQRLTCHRFLHHSPQTCLTCK